MYRALKVAAAWFVIVFAVLALTLTLLAHAPIEVSLVIAAAIGGLKFTGLAASAARPKRRH